MVQKLYYKIGEVAQMLNEEVSAIRFWSDTFPKYIKPERNAKGNRMYHPSDLECLKRIHYLTRNEGMTLEGVARRLAEKNDGLDHKIEIAEKLSNIRAMLVELQENI